MQVENLKLQGGDHVAGVVASILQEIFTNHFAKEVSFTGQGPKAVCGIKNSKLHKIVISKHKL